MNSHYELQAEDVFPEIDAFELSDEEEIRRTAGFRRPAFRAPVQSRRPAMGTRGRPAARPGARPPYGGRRPYPPGLRRPLQAALSYAGASAPQASEYVRWVQSALNQVMGAQLPVDGIMSPATRNALRDFQQREGLPVDGIAGPQTRDALVRAQSSAGPPGGPEPQQEFYERELYEQELSSGLLTEEEWEDEEWEDEVNRTSKDYIRWVQTSLNKLLGLTLAVDGIQGPITTSAIRSFQTKFGLQVDGIVGPQTEGTLVMLTMTQPPQAPSGGGASGSNSAVNTPLPASGPGFYNKHGSNSSRSYGLPQTIEALKAVGRVWHSKYPAGPRVGIGDISFRGGGHMPPHVSHTRGVDADIRLVRSDGKEAGVNYRDAAYSRSRTQDLVNTVRANGVLRVQYIFFNDPAVTGVKPWQGHDDHMHVRFYEP